MWEASAPGWYRKEAFPTWALQNGSRKEERPFCHQQGSDREYTISIPKHIHGVGLKKHAPPALRETRKFAMEEMGTPDVRIDTRLDKDVWAKGIRNIP